MLTTSFKSFKRGALNVSRSKGWKVIVSQTLRMLPLSRYWTWASRVKWAVSRVVEYFSNLQLWWLVTWQSFVNILSPLESVSILNSSFAFPKRPHLHRAYLTSGPIFFHLSVVRKSSCAKRQKQHQCKPRTQGRQAKVLPRGTCKSHSEYKNS